MKTLADMGEDALVRLLTCDLPLDRQVIAGAGDDCAVVRQEGKGRHQLLKTDVVVQGVHFTEATPPRLVGRKALARVVSDFAAMGGTPRHALITLVAPPETMVKRVQNIYLGIRTVAQRWGINIVGGETSRGAHLIVSVALTGSVPAGRWLGRNGGRDGDVLMVTGKLGGSLGGRHLTFEPRLKEGQWLARQRGVHAMMDISDGLAKDLPRLAAASGLGWRVDPEILPCHRGCTAQQAWGDGEDFELLLAVAPRDVANLQRRWQRTFPKLALTCIGGMVAAPSQTTHATKKGGWDHFQ